jgi:hypothetical protein
VLSSLSSSSAPISGIFPFSPSPDVRRDRATLSDIASLPLIIGLMSEIPRHGNDSGYFAPR